MSRQIFIHANNVHQGGGYVLLLALLKSLSDKFVWFATLDMRLRPLMDNIENGRIRWVAHSVLQRLNSEWWLSRYVQQEDVLICFGNLPPLFRSRGQVVVFMQNRYLVESLSLKDHSVAVRLRLRIERWWLILRAKNVDLFIVQTPTMKLLLQTQIRSAKIIEILPFAGNDAVHIRIPSTQSLPAIKYDFLYVASGEPHKNHRNLIEAWVLLAQQGFKPSLALTLSSREKPLFLWIKKQIETHDLKIINLGHLPHDKLLNVYGNSTAFIYPSIIESFGLPLIEASQAGLPIVASELDFVRDVCVPQQTFDPNSPNSIARAVRRFIGKSELPLQPVGASEFLSAVLDRVV